MKTKIFIFIAFLFVFPFLTLNSGSFAQFKFDKVESYTEFGEEEKEFSLFPYSRYNRVEGLFLGSGVRLKPRKLPGVEIISKGGYGFESKAWRYHVELCRSFFESNALTLGVGAFESTESLDDWFIGDLENSLSALFMKEDFKDYFGRQGFKAFADQKLFEKHTLRLEVASYKYHTMKRRTNWSILGGHKNFRDNPPVAEGKETSLKLMVALDWRDNPFFTMNGWYLEGIYEKTFRDFDTDGIFLTVKRYQQSFGNQRLRVRAMLGTRKGSIAEQHLMDLGGIGSLRGFRDKEFKNGNRLLLLNVNYLFGGDVLRKIPLSFIPFYDALTLNLFADLGWLGDVNPQVGMLHGFDKLSFNRLKTNVGWSLVVTEELIRIDFAKRTDRSKDAWRITFRVLQKF